MNPSASRLPLCLVSNSRVIRPVNSVTNTGGSSLGSRNPALWFYYEIPVTPGTTLYKPKTSMRPLQAVQRGSARSARSHLRAFEYWHPNESAFDDLPSKVPYVQAGQKLSNINIILNQTPPRFDLFEDEKPIETAALLILGHAACALRRSCRESVISLVRLFSPWLS